MILRTAFFAEDLGGAQGLNLQEAQTSQLVGRSVDLMKKYYTYRCACACVCSSHSGAPRIKNTNCVPSTSIPSGSPRYKQAGAEGSSRDRRNPSSRISTNAWNAQLIPATTSLPEL
ncbi:hypothetical protein C8J55DRAFT_496917 [Lentinula edodes]|uniref:Uncharacterized protein n=1 Tax=Lentinula lateritia TaxID=40482 RepID=A0A9W9E142_9AGAR|nr:hypothetical protein C8J55DRAFT_496917 [Lentinula edodes]